LNIKGVFIHMVADAGVTIGVIIAALLIQWTGWQWFDPAMSILIAIVILAGTWGLLRDSVNLVMDAVPPGIDQEDVSNDLRSLRGVSEIHDLHIWGLSTTDVAATMHVVRNDRAFDAALLHEITDRLRDRFGIVHPTIQFETPDMARKCTFRSNEVV
jgi:cobalt-zinc-cadmium efflux system protein